jgi:hypothetical protein
MVHPFESTVGEICERKTQNVPSEGKRPHTYQPWALFGKSLPFDIFWRPTGYVVKGKICLQIIVRNLAVYLKKVVKQCAR